MPLYYSKSAVDDLRSKLNIVDVVGRVVPLRRSGANYKGLCPFHSEKTPSFVVSEQKQIFTCFGCGASGDVVGFTMRYYNLEYGDAVEKLGREYGITVELSRSAEDREKYYEINREAARFFYRAFTEQRNPGYTYMRRRGIEDATLKKFGIGYADGSWDSLYHFLRERGIEEKVLLELGLISESKGKYYDKFRDRVIFPIINTSGRVIGFGGRAIGDDTPKYLNSPESRIFQKKNNLYALNTTKQDIGREGYAILVEGYMDAIALYQAGVHNVIASLGTALTENQVKLIKRYTKQVVLSYDADSAGQNASLRGMDILSREGCKVRVLHVTEGKDPDEFIKKNGRDAFLALVDEAMPYIDYKLTALQRGLDLETEEGKIDFLRGAGAVLREVSPVEAEVYIQKLARELHIAESAIKLEMVGQRPAVEVQSRPAAGEVARRDDEQPALSSLEANVLKAVFMEPSLTEKLLETDGMLESALSRKVKDLIFEFYGLYGDFHLEQVMDRLDPEESEALAAALDKVVVCGNGEEVFEQCVRTWQLLCLNRREQDLIARLALVDGDTENASVEALTKELMEIQQQKTRMGE